MGNTWAFGPFLGPRKSRPRQSWIGSAAIPGAKVHPDSTASVGTVLPSTWSLNRARARPRRSRAVRVTRNPLLRKDHSARSATEFECQSPGLGGETFPGEH